MSFVPLHPAPQRILIVKPSAIGDVVHTLPILNLIKRRWPDAKISWLSSPVCAPLLEGHRQIEEVIVFNRTRYGHAWRSPTASTAFFKFIASLRARKFDWAVDFQGLFRSGWMSWMSGAPVRVGFEDAREGAPAFYTHRVDSGGWWHQHAIGRYQHLAAALGCENDPIEFEFAINDADRALAARLVPPATPYAALVPGSIWETKRWPAEKFDALVKPLRERFGLQTVVLGGPNDIEVAGKIAADFNLAGETTLRESIALLERAELVIANDSGPMHIASGLRRPLVALFGPTHPVLTGPYGRLDSVIRLDLPCSPCYGRTCFHRSCLNWLDVESVLNLAEKQIKRYGAASRALAPA